jgi:hypothetical protein
MKLAGVVQAIGETLGLGAVREARQLVGRLPQGDLLVATSDETIARALGRARHRRALVDGSGLADAALSRELPEGDEGLVLLERLAAATRAGGVVIVGRAQPLSGSLERQRAAGLVLRAGLVELRQEADGGTVFTSGRVRRAT